MGAFIRLATAGAARFVRVGYSSVDPEGVLPLESNTVLNAATPLLYSGGYLP